MKVLVFKIKKQYAMVLDDDRMPAREFESSAASQKDNDGEDWKCKDGKGYTTDIIYGVNDNIRRNIQ